MSKFRRLLGVIIKNYQFQSLLIGLVGKVFANGPGDLGSVPGRVIPKTSKMVLDTSLLNTQQYKVRIKDKLEQSWQNSNKKKYKSLRGPTYIYIYIHICHASHKHLCTYMQMQKKSRWHNGQRAELNIVVSEFELQSRYLVHFRCNTLGKGINPLISWAMV